MCGLNLELTKYNLLYLTRSPRQYDWVNHEIEGTKPTDKGAS